MPIWSYVGLMLASFGTPQGPRRPKVEAKVQTKMLFEIAGQNFFRDRFRPDEQNYIGSVAGLGAIAPLEIRPLSLSGSAWAVERKRVVVGRSTM